MELERKTESNVGVETSIEGSTSERIHKFSIVHGSLPDEYVPEWKRNVPFRTENINLAKTYGVAWSTHGDTAFLGKRERLEDTERNVPVGDLERVVDHPPSSHLSKYNSSLLHRCVR